MGIVIIVSFFLMLSGLCIVTGGVLLLTLYIAGKWPGYNPRQWDNRFKKLLLVTGCGLVLVLAGIIAGYAI